MLLLTVIRIDNSLSRKNKQRDPEQQLLHRQKPMRDYNNGTIRCRSSLSIINITSTTIQQAKDVLVTYYSCQSFDRFSQSTRNDHHLAIHIKPCTHPEYSITRVDCNKAVHGSSLVRHHGSNRDSDPWAISCTDLLTSIVQCEHIYCNFLIHEIINVFSKNDIRESCKQWRDEYSVGSLTSQAISNGNEWNEASNSLHTWARTNLCARGLRPCTPPASFAPRHKWIARPDLVSFARYSRNLCTERPRSTGGWARTRSC